MRHYNLPTSLQILIFKKLYFVCYRFRTNCAGGAWGGYYSSTMWSDCPHSQPRRPHCPLPSPVGAPRYPTTLFRPLWLHAALHQRGVLRPRDARVQRRVASDDGHHVEWCGDLWMQDHWPGQPGEHWEWNVCQPGSIRWAMI